MTMHTDREYENELERLRERILLMGAKVESMLAGSIRAFQEHDGDLARRMLEADHEVNRLEVEIDSFCLSILARRQPVASDPRFITSSLKLVTDLERMGDLAVNISERVIDLHNDPPRKPYPNLVSMAETVLSMVRDALDAFVRADSAMAQWVIERDRSVDAAYGQVNQDLVLAMMGDRGSIQRGMRVQAVAKYYRAHRRPRHQPRRDGDLPRPGPGYSPSPEPGSQRHVFVQHRIFRELSFTQPHNHPQGGIMPRNTRLLTLCALALASGLTPAVAQDVKVSGLLQVWYTQMLSNNLRNNSQFSGANKYYNLRSEFTENAFNIRRTEIKVSGKIVDDLEFEVMADPASALLPPPLPIPTAPTTP
jgi:phosphate transport system protein